MAFDLRRHRLTGIIPPVVTPLGDHDQLDNEGLERLIEHLIAGGVSGLFVLGSTGEGPHLSYRLRLELVERTCELAAERVPVLAGISDTSLVDSIHLACHAESVGASAVVASVPYYYRLQPEEIADYFQQLAAQSPLPVTIYNMPACTKVCLDSDTIRACTQLDNVLGIKDSSGDLDYFRSLIPWKHVRPDWTILMGPELLLPDAIAAGGDGGVNGGANLIPRLYVQLYQAAVRQDQGAIASLRRRVEIVSQLYSICRGSVAMIKGLKAALAEFRICCHAMSAPFSPATCQDREQMRQILKHETFAELRATRSDRAAPEKCGT